MSRCVQILVQSAALGLLMSTMTPAYSEDATRMPTTDHRTLGWTGEGLVTTVPTTISIKLQEVNTMSHGSGGNGDDDDDDSGEAGDSGPRGHNGVGLEYEDDDDEDEFKRPCACQSTATDPVFGALVLLCLGLTVVGRRRQSTRGA